MQMPEWSGKKSKAMGRWRQTRLGIFTRPRSQEKPGGGGCGSRPVKKSQSNETEYVKEQLLERIYVLHLKAQGEKFPILHTRDNHFI